MTEKVRCACMRCRMAGLMWPAILITLGVLLLIAEYSNRLSLMDILPIILIVIGVVKLIEATASTEGHISAVNPPQGL
jgi:membrane-bound ClpP family serine protease